MSDFNPGEGWREVRYGAELSGHEHITWDSTGLADSTARIWVREEPVPPLPTEPYTVIRVTWKDEVTRQLLEDDLMLDIDGMYWLDAGDEIAPEALTKRIAGFEVLSEPRAVTAKAVLDRIASEPWAREVDLTKWRCEFGVQ